MFQSEKFKPIFFDNSPEKEQFSKAHGHLSSEIQRNLVQKQIFKATFVSFVVTGAITQEFQFVNHAFLLAYWYLSFLMTGQTKMVMKD